MAVQRRRRRSFLIRYLVWNSRKSNSSDQGADNGRVSALNHLLSYKNVERLETSLRINRVAFASYEGELTLCNSDCKIFSPLNPVCVCLKLHICPFMMSMQGVCSTLARVFIIIKISRESLTHTLTCSWRLLSRPKKTFELKLLKHAVHTGIQIFLQRITFSARISP